MTSASSFGGIPEYARQTIEAMQAKICEYEQEVVKKKKGINAILDSFGKQPIYSDLEPSASTDAGPIHPGQFYGQPLATAVRSILTRRRLANKNAGPATVTEIYDALATGGYLFETTEPENAKRGLRNSIGKNAIFHKLPTGHYGLTEWFPNIKQPKTKPTDEKNDADPPAQPQEQLADPSATATAQSESSKPRKGKAAKSDPVSGKDEEFDFSKKEAELSGAAK